MSSTSSPTPPAPVIGKIGPYTVFLTPPSPSPSPSSPSPSRSPSPSPCLSPRKVVLHSPPSPRPAAVQVPVPTPTAAVENSPPLPPPPVIPPPAQYLKPDVDRFGFFWDAVSRVQHVHSSVDAYVANWLGLNQSKYQWALDDFYESKGGPGLGKGDVKANEVSSQTQCV